MFSYCNISMSSRQVSAEDTRQFLAACDAALGPDLDEDEEDDADETGHGLDANARYFRQQDAPINHREDSEDGEEIICAISESRASHVVGIAAINITTGTAELYRIINDDKYGRLVDTLSRMPILPGCFLVLESIAADRSKSLLAPVLENEYPSIPHIPFERRHWGESEGLRLVERFALEHEVDQMLASLEGNFYVTCAFCAVSGSLLTRNANAQCTR